MNSIDRRAFLRTGLVAAGLGGLAAGCASLPARRPASSSHPRLIEPHSPQVAAAEAARPKTGRTRTYALTAAAGLADLGGPTVRTWSYGGQIPGPAIRVTKGDLIDVTVDNQLPAATTIHWHGVAICNDMDGVPPITQAAVPSGGRFRYRFTAAEPGTYWFHPHAGVQLDRGLYAPLIIEDPTEPAPYDHDWTVVLDDWLDGTGRTPDQVLASLRQGMGHMNMTSPSASPGRSGMGGMHTAAPSPAMSGMGGIPSPATGGGGGMSSSRGMSAMPGSGSGGRPGSSALLGGDAGDVSYPYYLINGRIPAAPHVFTGRPRQRARIRFINAAADTAFRVALGGHQMTVTHTDGFPVVPVRAGALLIGMGERYDVEVTLGGGVFPLTALAEGKNASALALVRTGAGRPPRPGVRPRELNGPIPGYGPSARDAALRPAASVALPARSPEVTHRLALTGGMGRYDWAINGQPYNPDSPQRFLVRPGQRARVIFANRTAMYHPMHIHGHTFQLADGGPRKDTVIVLPGQQVACDVEAVNPGQWVTHCHNIYHQESGMMAILAYQA